MIYPEKLSSKKSDALINALLFCSVMIAIVLVLINKVTTPNISWAGIANVGIIYIWITVIYSIKRNANIAAHVLLQMIAISLVMLYIDIKLKFYGWSVYIGIPIVLMIANTTMLVLSIVNHNNYTKYALYQLIIFFISIMQIFLTVIGIMELNVLNIISLGIALMALIISLCIDYKAFYRIIKCKFHM